MPLYEHVFISRQDLSNTQAEGLIEHFSTVLADNGGKVVENEYWGVKTMAYKINKNRKGHYAFLKSDAPAAAVQEMERLMRLHDDVMRVLTVKVDKHEEGPSTQMQKRDDRGERGDRPDRGERGERPERGFGGDRGDRGGFGGDRGAFEVFGGFDVVESAGDGFGEQGFAVGDHGGFLGIEGEDFAFGAEDLAVDDEFAIHVDHGFDDTGVVAFFFGDGAGHAHHGGVHFGAFGVAHFLAGAIDGGGGAC